MKKSGFTLVELLVVIASIAILFAIGVANFNTFNRRQILAQSTETLRTNLRLAQDKALAGEKPTDWCDGLGETLVGHQLRFVSEGSYIIEAICSNVAVDSYPTLTVNLPTNVTGPDGATVLFRVLGQGGVETATSFTLVGYGGIAQGGTTATVVVEETGNIYISEGGGGGGTCDCSSDPDFDNFCYYPPSTEGCSMTFPGGYCDPNGDGDYSDADWNQGYYDYLDQCGGETCPCSSDPDFDNFCFYAPSTPDCSMTFPGGYCDPNGDGNYSDADWNQGYYDYLDQCGS